MLGIFAAAALVAAGAASAEGLPNEPRIVVAGSGSVKNPPNVAEITYHVNGEGQTSDQAVAQLVQRSRTVEDSLHAVDPAFELHSETMQVRAIRGKDCEEDRYDEVLNLSKGPCAVMGYVANQDFTIRTSRVNDAGTLVGLAGRGGASNPKIGDFDLADDREARRQAIAKALADAQAKAEAVAAGSHGQLGKAISISLDGASESVQDIVVTGASYRANAPSPPIAVSLNPEPVETTARVTVTYSVVR
jgi:uncharacterized protein